MSAVLGHPAGPLSFAAPRSSRRWWRRPARPAVSGGQPQPGEPRADAPEEELPGIDVAHANLRRAEQALAGVADRDELVRLLAECERARAEFLTQLHHELRTPTTTLLGYLEVIRDGDGGVLNPVQRWMIARAEEGAHRLARVLDGLRAMEDCAARTRREVEGG
jgi:signal transduction histidine kinase